ncbi:MAG: ABC transporter permease [Anaerolineales bacterium]|nr:ABC transporter permease [Anaerolineales bacterium]
MRYKLPKAFHVQELGVILILIVLIVILGATAREKFLNPNTMFNMVRNFSWIAVTGFGELLVIIIAGIDLSVASTMAFAGLISAMLLVRGIPVPIAVFGGLVGGFLVGMVNGLLVSKGRLPAFIATLGMMSVVRGIVYGVTQGQPVMNLPVEFMAIGRYDIPILGLKVPLPVILMLAIALLVHIFLSKTIWGYRIYAMGGNEQSTRLSGVNTVSLKLLVFSLTGIFAATGGLLMTARLGVAMPNGALGYELDVIAAVFIGGASTSGGSGTTLGVLIGAAIMQVLRTGMVLLGIDPYWQNAAIGLIILISLMIDQIRRR